MNFLEWLTTRRKTLATMDSAELRAQEMLIGSDRDRMQARAAKLGREKQNVIQRGAAERTQELRQSLAQQYDLLHTEQLMLARQVNLRTKELLTITRLRMLRESVERGIGATSGLAAISAGDLATIERLIQNDQVTSEVYQERLDELLRGAIGTGETQQAISPAAAELMRVWNDMDAGLIKDPAAAFDEAERRVRERSGEASSS